MLILINDKWIEKDEAKVDLFSDALMFGFGVFETLRTYEGKKLFLLDEHIDRLTNSLQQIRLELNYSRNEIKKMVQKVVGESENDLQRIKIITIPEKLIVVSSKLEINQKVYQGASVMSIQGKRSLPHIKSTSYLDCYLGYQRAIEAGFNEAIFIDKHNYVLEGTRSNMFWFDDEMLCTRENDILPGIIRSFIIENSSFKFKYQNIKIDELKNKDEIFITNSVLGVVPVIKIDDKTVKNGKSGQRTNKLMNIFNNAIKK